SWQPDLEYMAALPTLDSLAPAAGNSWYSQGPQGPTAWRGPMPTIPQMGAPQAYGTRPLYCPMPTDLSAVQASGQWRANGACLKGFTHSPERCKDRNIFKLRVCTQMLAEQHFGLFISTRVSWYTLFISCVSQVRL
ncbi:unnamed protein product, partial [Durusdinium trenchii]